MAMVVTLAWLCYRKKLMNKDVHEKDQLLLTKEPSPNGLVDRRIWTKAKEVGHTRAVLRM
jgi:hypothetical protein